MGGLGGVIGEGDWMDTYTNIYTNTRLIYSPTRPLHSICCRTSRLICVEVMARLASPSDPASASSSLSSAPYIFKVVMLNG